MNQVEIQIASRSKNLPSQVQFQTWVNTALNELNGSHELVIRLVDETESATLNQYYRHQSGATNVLSFPFETPKTVASSLLGDLVICTPLIEQQAQQQQKPVLDHWAHIVIHGVLHLCGYDHIDDAESQVMEAREIDLLQTLSISNPYQEPINYE